MAVDLLLPAQRLHLCYNILYPIVCFLEGSCRRSFLHCPICNCIVLCFFFLLAFALTFLCTRERGDHGVEGANAHTTFPNRLARSKRRLICFRFQAIKAIKFKVSNSVWMGAILRVLQ